MTASYIEREISSKVRALLKGFPLVLITGPRQSGKSTLVQHLFASDYRYVTLDNPDILEFVRSDPRGFLREYSDKVIIDEAQRAPALFNYLQGVVDSQQVMGQYILTGSHHFLLLEQITQSLAGRVAVLHLLPLSLTELKGGGYELEDLEATLYRGFYPPVCERKLEVEDWYGSYLMTYVERDVRLIKNVHDLQAFQHFIRLCAARTGQLVDLTSLGNDAGISQNTVRSWLTILQASFVIYLLQPHYRNFNKRLVKMPKIYFYDTGLLCYLLGIESPEQLKTHYLRGGVFESYVLGEILKARYNQGKQAGLYFWRDRRGHEIDCLIEQGTNLVPVEIKSSRTIASDFFSGLQYWTKLAGVSPSSARLVYAGEASQKRSAGHAIGWQDAYQLGLG